MKPVRRSPSGRDMYRFSHTEARLASGRRTKVGSADEEVQKQMLQDGYIPFARAKISDRFISICSPVSVFTSTNLNWFLRLCATSTSAAVREKKYPEKSARSFFREDF